MAHLLALQATAETSDTESGRTIHADAVPSMHLYAKCSDAEAAQSVFERIRAIGSGAVDVVSVGTVNILLLIIGGPYGLCASL